MWDDQKVFFLPNRDYPKFASGQIQIIGNIEKLKENPFFLLQPQMYQNM